jgi:tRNA A-37 threonylcarbamoyl transferase component Bud32
MDTLEFWPGLAEAWNATGDSPPESAPAAPRAVNGARWRLIKTEPRVRVLWLEAEGFAPAVFKIYRVPSRLAWRTFGLASRANREFTVMMAAHRLGLAVVRPRYWMESRVWGCVEFSAIALDAIDGTNLETWLIGGAGDRTQRRRAAEASGRLLGRFHRAGLFAGTFSPRNLLLPGGDIDSMRVIDLPYARLYGHGITGDHHATADIGRALRLSNGQHAFDDAERERFMFGYCAGDPGRARDLNARLRLMSHKEWKRQRFLRRFANLLSKHTRSPGRGGIYCSETGDLRALDSGAVFLDQPVEQGA